MKAIGFSIEDCRNALESYAAEIDELMALVNGAATMTPAKIEEARTQLSNLKSCLKQDYKRRDTKEGRAKMTEVEAAIFAPAVLKLSRTYTCRSTLARMSNGYPNFMGFREPSTMP